MKRVIVRLLKNWYTTPAHEVIQDNLENLPDKHIRPKEMNIGDMSWDAKHVLDDKIPDTPLEGDCLPTYLIVCLAADLCNTTN